MAIEQIEEYLEAIGRLEERGERVSTSSLANALQLSAPSVTEMLGRLSERGLVSYRPRGEILLTGEGRALARSVMRRHRLWERFLHDVLGVRWDSVHGEACRLEHATSPLVERELARAVGDSATCPHGQSIPTTDGEVLGEPSVPLLEISPTQSGRVVSVAEDDPVVLRRLEELGIEPGVVVELRSLDLAAEAAVLGVGESSIPVPIDLVRAIQVAQGATERMHPMPLAQLAPGQSAVVDRQGPGRRLAARALALGLTPGAPLTVIHNGKNGPLIVRVRDGRVALGRGEAQKIQVLVKSSPDGAHVETG